MNEIISTPTGSKAIFAPRSFISICRACHIAFNRAVLLEFVFNAESTGERAGKDKDKQQRKQQAARRPFEAVFHLCLSVVPCVFHI
ncbi:MAG: hypothetical protein KIC97_03475 [Firmicutes bacterium]|nr:hypothetical protein [Bacillota bacterium]